MTVSAVSTTSVSPQAASRGGAMKSLVDGINSGDLTSAKAAFDTLQKNRQGATGASGTASQRDEDIAAIGKALDSGDADAAKQALAKLRDDRKEASGGAQETHHHHGHRAHADGAASLTYSASATTAPSAAPGSTIDVQA
ncbi:hypothetical protein SAMN05428966_103370 [Massilia sp. PDC64]|nr:hypothetical protein [Massilia sp. PDC64]SDD16917.1 hypothetical protein SAMN05428966_103370 [Massilia sp. PDC64]